MNILYFVNYFPPSTGAAALNSLKIAELLVKSGHNLLVLAPGDMGKTLNLKSAKVLTMVPNLKVNYSNYFIRSPLSWIFSHIENMTKFLLKVKNIFSPDIILTQYHPFHYASVIGGYISKILKIPHIIRSHDIFVDLASHSIPYNLYISINYPHIYHSISNCDLFYVTTSEMVKYFLKFKKLKNINFKVHHNGIDINQFYPFKNQEELKEKYGCETIISFIGLMTQDIGIQNFILNFPDLLKYKRDTHLILIGGGSYENHILKLIRKLKLSNQVHFLGIRPHNQIPFYMNNSDIGIGRITHKKMWRYMIPVKCLEYMACKKPLITTPISHDIIKNNDVGLLLRRDFKKKELIDNLIMLIEDKNLRMKLGERGYKKISQNFIWDDLMRNFNKDLLNLVKES
jgi:glycosyltransferase involved in cell wall biosynthesis